MSLAVSTDWTWREMGYYGPPHGQRGRANLMTAVELQSLGSGSLEKAFPVIVEVVGVSILPEQAPVLQLLPNFWPSDCQQA